MGHTVSKLLLHSLGNHTLELPRLVGTVNGFAPSVNGCKNGTVSVLYKNMHGLVLKNEFHTI
jgi:hypothetical protein